MGNMLQIRKETYMSLPSNPIPSKEWQRLQEEYRSTIPQKLDELKQRIDAAQKSPTKETLGALRFAVHRLAGSAGTYGFAEVSSICKKTELEVLEKIDQFPISFPNPKWLSDLSKAL